MRPFLRVSTGVARCANDVSKVYRGRPKTVLRGLVSGHYPPSQGICNTFIEYFGRQLKPRQVVLVLRECHAVGLCTCEATLRDLLRRCVADLSGDELAMAANALSRARDTDRYMSLDPYDDDIDEPAAVQPSNLPVSGLLSGVAADIMAALPGMSPSSVALVANAFARLQLRSPDVFRAIADRCTQVGKGKGGEDHGLGLSDFSLASVAMIAHGFAKLRIYHHRFYRALLKTVLARKGDVWNLGELAQCVFAFARSVPFLKYLEAPEKVAFHPGLDAVLTGVWRGLACYGSSQLFADDPKRLGEGASLVIQAISVIQQRDYDWVVWILLWWLTGPSYVCHLSRNTIVTIIVALGKLDFTPTLWSAAAKSADLTPRRGAHFGATGVDSLLDRVAVLWRRNGKSVFSLSQLTLLCVAFFDDTKEYLDKGRTMTRDEASVTDRQTYRNPLTNTSLTLPTADDLSHPVHNAMYATQAEIGVQAWFLLPLPNEGPGMPLSKLCPIGCLATAMKVHHWLTDSAGKPAGHVSAPEAVVKESVFSPTSSSFQADVASIVSELLARQIRPTRAKRVSLEERVGAFYVDVVVLSS
ncbi:unnamed protein product [Vitrella brassicaformis CCMP3155]|uniref:Uncharacterized protein n=1 Tax=Vitrella brassicaformis (strain CCMP3155) TaxID=1169540 RepID=A0A0G4ERE6_VITBC|nr:unnamed protein product [Vitrella brassicaformis CCMP3155]|eukprot:CEM00843.1 unnamed protein product [Vitrella brassicaformis CCMP3155]